MKNVEFKENVNMSIKSYESPDGKNKWELRIVSWNDGKPKLEKRNYWRKSQDEEFKPGKLVGLDYDDYLEVESRTEDIKKILKTK